MCTCKVGCLNLQKNKITSSSEESKYNIWHSTYTLYILIDLNFLWEDDVIEPASGLLIYCGSSDTYWITTTKDKKRNTIEPL